MHQMHRARLMDAEWRNGIRLMKGEDIMMRGVAKLFQDKNGPNNGVFYWD
jgi:hypothetical protein